MALVHNVEIVWDELMDAFTSGLADRVYYLDRLTGEIFFVPSSLSDEDVWRQLDANHDRFLEIPRFDFGIERQLMNGFVKAIQDTELRRLLDGAVAGRRPFGDLDEILSFFPEEGERLKGMKDELVASRVKNWLEQNNLFTAEPELLHATRL